MLEGGEEAQEDDQTAFTARTAHVAARLKVGYASLPISQLRTAAMQRRADNACNFAFVESPYCLKLDSSTLAKWLRCVARGQHRWVSCHRQSL